MPSILDIVAAAIVQNRGGERHDRENQEGFESLRNAIMTMLRCRERESRIKESDIYASL